MYSTGHIWNFASLQRGKLSNGIYSQGNIISLCFTCITAFLGLYVREFLENRVSKLILIYIDVTLCNIVFLTNSCVSHLCYCYTVYSSVHLTSSKPSKIHLISNYKKSLVPSPLTTKYVAATYSLLEIGYWIEHILFFPFSFAFFFPFSLLLSFKKNVLSLCWKGRNWACSKY
jgi:hypothetical protein